MNDIPASPDIPLVADLLSAGDIVLYVVPDDGLSSSLPTPRSSALEEVIGSGGMLLFVRETEMPRAITSLNRAPALIVTDGGAFERVAAMVPRDVPITSAPMLAARQKGNLNDFVDGLRAVDRLQPDAGILIATGCPGRGGPERERLSRLPPILRTLAGGPLRIVHTNGDGQFPDSLREYELVIHCGACTLARTEMLRRQAVGRRDGVPLVNWDVLESHVSHVLPRAVAPLRRNGLLDATYNDIVGPAS